MKTRIYYVRHGQSYGNQHRIFLGHTDKDLTDIGKIQAKRAAERLADVEFSAIYSSDLSRAYNTAVPHAEMRGVEIIADKRLRELYCGDWENLAVDEIIARYGELYTYSWVHEFGTFRLPGGESVQEGAQRMYDMAIEMAKAHEGTNILCTTHAAVIRALFSKVMGIAPNEVAEKLPYPSNASYSILEYDGEYFTVLSFSEDDHLGDLFTTWKD